MTTKGFGDAGTLHEPLAAPIRSRMVGVTAKPSAWLPVGNGMGASFSYLAWMQRQGLDTPLNHQNPRQQTTDTGQSNGGFDGHQIEALNVRIGDDEGREKEAPIGEISA